MILQQLLQNHPVECMVVVDLLLCGAEGPGHRDGAAHHGMDGHGEWQQTPGVVREEATAPEDARRKAHEPLEGDQAQMLPGVHGKGLQSEDVILPKGIHGEQGDPRKGGKRGRVSPKGPCVTSSIPRVHMPPNFDPKRGVMHT